MSTSDSDYSIDWLASDEDDSDSDADSDSAQRLNPQDSEETHVAPSSSSSPSSSVSCSHCGAVTRRRRRRSSDSQDEGPDSRADTLSPVQGFTSVGAELRSNRKRLHSDGENGLCEKPEADTENELFLHKCLELQGYIPPLSSILQALISGRYSDRLGSFQENVAIDRIQRILGVLQNPHLGGRFLNILLKVEVMLLSWFPHIRPSTSQIDDGSATKKLQPHSSASAPPPPAPPSSSDLEPPLAASPPSSTRLKWLHTSPICSLKTPESSFTRRPAFPLSTPPTRCRQEVTQDNAVSSTSDLHSAPPRHLLPAAAPRISRGPLPFKIRSPCLERLLQAKESIIAPRTDEEEGWTL